jgi:DNA-binding transcriptional LysR family regulator
VVNHLSRLDPTSLKLFISVVKEGTIAAAAAREHMAAATVSNRLIELEDALRTELLLRTNRGVEPTMAGVALLNLARTALDGLEDVYTQMRDYAAGVRGKIRVVANASAIIQFLPADIASFLAQHPGVDVDLSAESSEFIVKAVAENAADVGICLDIPHPENLPAFPYREDRLALIVPAAHALAGRSSVSFLETLEHDYVGFHLGSAADIRLADAAAIHHRALKVRIQAANYDTLCHLVNAGLGIGIMPQAIAAPYLRSLQIRMIALDEPWARRELKIYVRRCQAPSVTVGRFVEHLKRGPSLRVDEPECHARSVALQ